METHFVVAYNHETGKFGIDYDGTIVWIRDLFPDGGSNTWSDEQEDYVSDDKHLLDKAFSEFEKLLGGQDV